MPRKRKPRTRKVRREAAIAKGESPPEPPAQRIRRSGEQSQSKMMNEFVPDCQSDTPESCCNSVSQEITRTTTIELGTGNQNQGIKIENSTKVKLETRDGVYFFEELDVIMKLGTIKDKFHSKCTKHVELNDLSSVPLFNAIEWAEHYHNKDKGTATNEVEDEDDSKDYELNTWERRYLEFDTYSLLKLHEVSYRYKIENLQRAVRKAATLRGFELANVVFK